MLYQVTHTTTYEYADSVSLCQNLAHLTPRETATQKCLDTWLSITPDPSVLSERMDYFGNLALFFAVQEPHRNLMVTAEHQLELTPRSDPLDKVTPWEQVRDILALDRSPVTLEAAQFLFESPFVRVTPALEEYARVSFQPGRPLLEATEELTARIFTEFSYDPRATTIATPLEQVFETRRGVCQDFAHLQIACIRSLGLAARYVSGYLCTTPPPGKPRMIGVDATHAWISVYCPLSGWVDFDATNNLIPTDKHLLLAWGRDFDDVSPIKGVTLGGGSHTVQVEVDVLPLDQE